MNGHSVLERACRDSIDRPVLLHAGSCPRCRWLARIILALSAGAITGIALDDSEWRDFYAFELPQSRGSPVLVLRGIPYWGPRVFAMTPWLALQGAMVALRRQL